jgi:uncharacterized protein YutE (UPF0331/DUF86 family)
VTALGVSKGQRRIAAILQEIPAVREQLFVTMEGFGPDFAEEELVAAAQSPDVYERNRVTVIERLYEVLLNWVHELAARALAEAQRLGLVDKSSGHPWERFAALDVISHESAARLQKAKVLRDILAHAYPPANWRTLHEGVLILVEELDSYLDSFKRWVSEEEILPPARVSG